MLKLPKYAGETPLELFLQSLGRQFADQGVPGKQGLASLEGCLESTEVVLASILCTTNGHIRTCKGSHVELSGVHGRNEARLVSVVKRGRDERIAQESKTHVESFCKVDNTGGKVKFKCIMTRLIEKCRQECAEAGGRESPILYIRQWEHKHGSNAKIM